MKPFDLEKAKLGYPVCNGYGMDVRILCYDLKDDKYPIAGAITDPETNRETLQKYTLDGYVIGDGANNNGDLFMKPEKKEGWINVFINSCSGLKSTDRIYSTKAEALKNIDTKSPHYIDTVKIEWEE